MPLTKVAISRKDLRDDEQPDVPQGSIWRYNTTGKDFVILGAGLLEKDATSMILYRSTHAGPHILPLIMPIGEFVGRFTRAD